MGLNAYRCKAPEQFASTAIANLNIVSGQSGHGLCGWIVLLPQCRQACAQSAVEKFALFSYSKRPENTGAFADDPGGDLSGQRGSLGAGADREGEDVQAGHGQIFNQAAGFEEVTLAFARKASDQIEADEDVRNFRDNRGNQFIKLGPGVASSHAGEDVIAAALQGQVQVPAEERRVCNQLEQFRFQFVRFD